MNKNLKEVIKAILLVLALLIGFWVSYNYKGPLPEEGGSPISLRGVALLVFIWICYKVYELSKRISTIESKLEEYGKKDTQA